LEETIILPLLLESRASRVALFDSAADVRAIARLCIPYGTSKAERVRINVVEQLLQAEAVPAAQVSPITSSSMSKPDHIVAVSWGRLVKRFYLNQTAQFPV
jgi:hypothetical protein